MATPTLERRHAGGVHGAEPPGHEARGLQAALALSIRIGHFVSKYFKVFFIQLPNNVLCVLRDMNLGSELTLFKMWNRLRLHA